VFEAMMGDTKALQAGTSHYLGQNFAKAFNVKFQTEDNKEELVYATSWGVSTRLIGALIMVHGDNKGLRLPPKVAPTQIVIVPIMRKDSNVEDILNYIKNLKDELKQNNIRFHIDIREKLSPGHKFNEWEMKGVPIRVEVGPRDMENGELVVCRRDNDTKQTISMKKSSETLIVLLSRLSNNKFPIFHISRSNFHANRNPFHFPFIKFMTRR
jgi:prolyl-tRNA synthetase